MTTAKKAAAKKTAAAPAADAPIVVAPPSPAAVVVSAASQLTPSLQQAQADITTLNDLLAAWPADVPASLQPVVEILLRAVEGEVLMAQSTAAMAQQTGIL